MQLTITATCPGCGKRKGLRTRVETLHRAVRLGRSRCYRCGYRRPAEYIRLEATRTTWAP